MAPAATLSVENFPALSSQPGIIHAFCGRCEGLDLRTDREAALRELGGYHSGIREELGLGKKTFVWGEQVHGAAVAVVTAETAPPVSGVDGLITADPQVCLGIYVADCCAIYLFDPRHRVIGLLHSGRRGSEQNIVGAALQRMHSEFGCAPRDVIVQLSPCIRSPHYEVDFAALIREDAVRAGAEQVIDCGTCTATHLDRYYSYRAERGKTGRMLALLALAKDD